MIIQDKNGDQWVVEKDKSGGNPKVTKVEGGGLVVGSDGKMIDENTLNKLEKMILKALKKYLKSLEDYQASAVTPGKGGGPSLFEWEINQLMTALPTCMVSYKKQLNLIKQNLVKVTTEASSFKSFVSVISERIENADNASEETVDQTVCEALVDGLEIDKLIIIEAITDEKFSAGIGDDKLAIRYSILAAAELNLKYSKIEIYKNDGSLAFEKKDIEIKENAILEWDGKLNQGPDADKYIRYDQSPFKIKITAGAKEDFSDALEETAEGNVDPNTDEWIDNKEMRKWVLCVKIVNGKEVQCEDSERYAKYTELKEIYSLKEEAFRDTNPLEYFKRNITFEEEGEDYKFLEHPIYVHKKFYPILKQVESYIKEKHGEGVYTQLAAKYKGLIGGFTMRYLNNGSAADSDVSPHGLGLAVDIDPKRNPQIIYDERPLVFFLIKKVTGTNFYPGAPKVFPAETKMAHNSFLAAFKNTSVNDLTDATAFKEIQDYNTNYPTYPLGSLDTDVIKNSIEELRQALNRIKELAPNPSQKENMLVSASTVNNKIFIIRTDIDKLESVVRKAFNRIIFTTPGKAAIVYLDDVYAEAIKMKLTALESIMGVVNEELKKPTPVLNTASFQSFLDADFGINKTKITPFVTEYNSFLSDIKAINSAYVNLSTYAANLKTQINRKDFENELFKDGFCDMDISILEGILLEAFSAQTEWGGHYKRKKDWMHFGINDDNYSLYLIE